MDLFETSHDGQETRIMQLINFLKSYACKQDKSLYLSLSKRVNFLLEVSRKFHSCSSKYQNIGSKKMTVR